jgi:aminoglycoside phosphotransferase (APT) family kinase protein
MATIDRQSTFSGTKDVPTPMAFDVGRLAAYLTAHLVEFAGPLNVKQFKGGQSNPTYLLETPARRHVLRRKPPGPLLPSAHAVDREYRVTAALHVHGFPVAEPLLFCDEDDVIGTAFYVMAHVEGRVIWEPSIPDASPIERAAIYDALNATIARLHNYDPAALGLADFGRGENYVARQVTRWIMQYRASQTEPIDDMERLIAWLPDHIPPAPEVRLVHGDFRLDNVILAPHQPSILAVLDWELSTLGDPLADFTYHLMQWDMPPSPHGAGVGTLVGREFAALGIPARANYVDAYRARTGLDPRPHLAVYLAYNFFRLAAIFQGIVGRVRDGTAASDHAAGMAGMVAPLAAKAWDFARAAGAR